jgi:multidrug efflux system membrane fusion protein
VQVRSIGTIEAYDTVGVKSLVEGQVVGVHFKEGQDVRKGQLLFTIDKRPFQEALHKAEAQLQKDIATAANARAQSARYEALQKQGVVAREQAEEIITAAQAADATVAADKAAVEQAKVQLDYCTIESPIDGRTGNLLVHEGNVVKANADNPMVTINRVSPIYATFSVPEQTLPEIKRYMTRGKLPVDAILPADPAPVRGSLSFIDNAVDPQTGMIKLKGTFANGDRKLWPGQFVDVVLTLTTMPNATVVPKPALQNGQSGTYVFVVKPDKTVENRVVKTGHDFGNDVVVDAGLHPGEVVVTDGQVRLVPGAKIAVQDSAPVSADSTPASPPTSFATPARPAVAVQSAGTARQAGQ